VAKVATVLDFSDDLEPISVWFLYFLTYIDLFL
jgi:hypothetical protein